MSQRRSCVDEGGSTKSDIGAAFISLANCVASHGAHIARLLAMANVSSGLLGAESCIGRP